MKRGCASGVVQEISQGQTARLRMRRGAVLLYATMRQKRWVAQMKICLEGMRVLEDDYLLALYKIEELRKLRKKIAREFAKRRVGDISAFSPRRGA